MKWTVKEGVLTSGVAAGHVAGEREGVRRFCAGVRIQARRNGQQRVRLRTPLKPAIRRSRRWNCRWPTCATTPKALDSELTGGIYRAIAPRKQVYKPTEWNKLPGHAAGNKAQGHA